MKNVNFATMNTILTITGSDSAGGAGIQADIKTITSLGGKALSVVTTLTMQNTLGIQDYYDIPAEIVERQIDAVAEDITPFVFKIGLVRNIYTLEAVVRCILRYKPKWVLFSPVVYSSCDEVLMSDELIERIQRTLVPLCDALVVRERDSERFDAKRLIVADNSHGRCNELCSAIATMLCREMSFDDAVKKAKNVLPTGVNSEMSSRCTSLYNSFVKMQEEECKNSRDVNYYASRLNVSPRYLSQVTRRVASQSPKSIIDSTLLGKIKDLLKTDKTIQEIASQLGFSSQAHLSNFFKRFTGASPSDFRKITE